MELPGLPKLDLSELNAYLPNFDPDKDPQAGDWVLVLPTRQETLLSPLVSMWERRPRPPARRARSPKADVTSVPCRYSLPHLISKTKRSAKDSGYVSRELNRGYCSAPSPPRSTNPNTSDNNTLTLSSVSCSWSFFTRRTGSGSLPSSLSTTAKTAATTGEASDATPSTTVPLYLCMRIGLITPTPPSAFGGRQDGWHEVAARDREGRLCLAALHIGTGMFAHVGAIDGALLLGSGLDENSRCWLERMETAAEREWAERSGAHTGTAFPSTCR